MIKSTQIPIWIITISIMILKSIRPNISMQAHQSGYPMSPQSIILLLKSLNLRSYPLLITKKSSMIVKSIRIQISFSVQLTMSLPNNTCTYRILFLNYLMSLHLIKSRRLDFIIIRLITYLLIHQLTALVVGPHLRACRIKTIIIVSTHHQITSTLSALINGHVVAKNVASVLKIVCVINFIN